MLYPDLYALLHSDPEAVRRLKNIPARARNSLENELPAAGNQNLYSYLGEAKPWEEQ